MNDGADQLHVGIGLAEQSLFDGVMAHVGFVFELYMHKLYINIDRYLQSSSGQMDKT